MKKLKIYGATGHTGRMAAQRASAAGTPLILAGRTKAALVALAGEDRAGFQIPAMLFGNAFAETIADTTIVDY